MIGGALLFVAGWLLGNPLIAGIGLYWLGCTISGYGPKKYLQDVKEMWKAL